MRSLVLVAAVLFSYVAAPAAHAAEDKIGVVDLQRALNEVEEGASAKKAEVRSRTGRIRARMSGSAPWAASLPSTSML